MIDRRDEHNFFALADVVVCTMAKTGGFHVVQRGVSRVWYMWWSEGGKKKWKRIEQPDGSFLPATASKAVAIRCAAAMFGAAVAEREAQAQPLQEPAPSSCPISTHDGLLDAYRSARGADWDNATIKQYENWMRDQRKFFGTVSVHSIDLLRAEAFKGWLSTVRKLAARTVRERVAFARRVFQWAVDVGWLDRNPFRLVKPPKPRPVRDADPFTPDEVRRILGTCRESFPWFFPCVFTAALTGARRNVLIMLDVGDFDRNERMLRVRPEIAKHDKKHEYSLPEELFDVLCGCTQGRADDEPLFLTRAGNRMSSKTFDLHVDKTGTSHLWRRLLKAAKVRPRGIHNMRAAVDTNLVVAGVPIDLATLVTGHSKEVAQRHYLRARIHTQRETIGRLVALYDTGNGNGARQVVIKLNAQEAKVLADQIQFWGERKQRDYGANYGASDRGMSCRPSVSRGSENMAERQGFEPWLPG